MISMRIAVTDNLFRDVMAVDREIYPIWGGGNPQFDSFLIGRLVQLSRFLYLSYKAHQRG
jgi:hypothetical protein